MNTEKRFLVVSIVPHQLSDFELYQNIQEVGLLIETYGGEIIDIVLQTRKIHDKGMYIGKGKTEEVCQLIVDKDIDVVILNDIIKPGQIYYFQTIFEKFNKNIQVWDRVDLILKIFSLHAYTAQSKLQIELAAMHHMGPRIYGMGEEMSRQGGMLGSRGIGETNTERMKRHWREQMKRVKDDLKKLSSDHQKLIESRRQKGFKTISLVGYTNAGKTSLFNSLTHSKKRVKDALFVTLESSLGKIYLSDTKQQVLISDTIGFIRDLPPELIEAFKSTLMESVYADLILNVIDLSDPDLERKIAEVEMILTSLNIDPKKIIYVFNKTDQANGIDRSKLINRYQRFTPLFISTKTGFGINSLIEALNTRVMNESSQKQLT